ncbi:MAG TPA: hypothetical protein VGD29_32250 [Actinoplanes sp.]|jgi:hypothetical protein
MYEHMTGSHRISRSGLPPYVAAALAARWGAISSASPAGIDPQPLADRPPADRHPRPIAPRPIATLTDRNPRPAGWIRCPSTLFWPRTRASPPRRRVRRPGYRTRLTGMMTRPATASPSWLRRRW